MEILQTPTKQAADSGSRFARVRLSPEEEQMALQVSPLFMAYLQNKIAVYAENVVDSKLPYTSDPQKQMEALMAFEKSKAFVVAYEELLAEILNSTNPT